MEGAKVQKLIWYRCPGLRTFRRKRDPIDQMANSYPKRLGYGFLQPPEITESIAVFWLDEWLVHRCPRFTAAAIAR